MNPDEKQSNESLCPRYLSPDVRMMSIHLHTTLTAVAWQVNPCFSLKGAVSQYSVIFCAYLREEKMATAYASVADIGPLQLGQPHEHLHRLS